MAVPRKIIDEALRAHDDGFRIIAVSFNSHPALQKAGVTIEAGSPAEGVTIENCRNRLANAFIGIRVGAPDVEHDDRKIYPWTLGFLNQKKSGHHLISLYWSEGTDTLEEEIENLIGVYGHGWTAQDWRDCVKTPVEAYALAWRQWLRGLAESDDPVVAIGEPNGPFGQQEFRWEGTTYAGIGPKPYTLIESLWLAPDRSLTVNAAETAVYGQIAPNVDGLKSLRREANKFFRQNGIPLQVKIRGGYKGLVALRDGHPTNRRVKNPRKSS